MKICRAFALMLMILFIVFCSSASRQPLPRLETYDFLEQTPADLVRLRQIAPAEGPEGALARYALARAHAEWLVLGLISGRNENTILQRLGVDLGIEGASLDDELRFDQIMQCVEAIELEVQAASAAGAEARQWANDMGQILSAVREGYESFDHSLFRTLIDVSAEPGPARIAADLLAVGWARVVFRAGATRPAQEQLPFLARMASFYDADVVAVLEAEDSTLFNERIEFGCDEAGGRGDRSALKLLDHIRRSCSGTSYNIPPNAGEVLSPELVVALSLIRDLLERRRRLGSVESDPLIVVAAEVLADFDRIMSELRLPLPLYAAGPRLPEVPHLRQSNQSWRPAAAVITVLSRDRIHVGLWPMIGVSQGEPRLLDWDAELPVPGRSAGSDVSAVLGEVLTIAQERWGIEDRRVALLLPADAEARLLFEIMDACERAQVSAIDLIVAQGNDSMASLLLRQGRGAARLRTSSDGRVIFVVGNDAAQISSSTGNWAEFQNDGSELPTDRITAALMDHVNGSGNPGCIVALRPDVSLDLIAHVLDVLATTPRSTGPSANRGWEVWLDPEEPPAPLPVAETAADAVSNHRVRLRQCYERYLRGGGQGQGSLVLELNVGGRGEVTEARVATTELGSQPSLDNCLVSEALRIRFPPSTDVPVIRVPLRLVPR